jgi:hypothetical protein
MPHPYSEHEGTALWAAHDAEIAELEANGDLELTTARQYVIGALCQRLVRSGLASAPPGDAPAP